MNTVTVKVDRLKKTLKKNRKDHRETYEKALERYRELAVREFEKNIRQVKKGKPVRRALALPLPEDHTKDYDRTLEMLEWEVGDEVELTEYEFQQYIQDDWGWKQSFTSNTTGYVTGAIK